ncbi:unnamed protein product, partial [marine sediment metagenome]
MKIIKLNLGSAREKKEGFIGLDIMDRGQEHICDFEKDPLPFKDETVDFILSKHVFEHLRDVKNILNECWRVLKRNQRMEVRVPYGLWNGASKPVHYQCITACWFDFLRSSDLYECYGYRPWDILELKEFEDAKGDV